MEVVSVLKYLDNKSILVVGAAGFLANSKSLYLSTHIYMNHYYLQVMKL